MTEPIMEFKESPIKKHIADRLEFGTKCFVAALEDGFIQVFVTPGSFEKGKVKNKWHVTIAHLRMMLDPQGRNFPGRLITWQEACFIKAYFVPPEIPMGILLPPNDDLEKFDRQFHLVEL